MRDSNRASESMIYVHQRWKSALGNVPGIRYFSSISDVPSGSYVIAPSERAEKFFTELGYNCVTTSYTVESVREVVQKLCTPTAKPSSDSRQVMQFSKQSQVVEFLERFMHAHSFFLHQGRIVHVKADGIRNVDRDYLAREVLRFYDCEFEGKDYIPTDRLCGLALAGVHLPEVDVVRSYPLYLPTPNPRVLSPQVELRKFGSKSEILENVEEYFALLCLPFQDIPSMASTLAAMLTPLVYAPCSPIWVITSSTPGVGKTLLAQSVFALSTGEILPVTPYPESEAEKRKQITSALLSSRPALIWDNLSTPLGGSSIDALTTSRSWRDRILGKSQMTEIPKFIALACTGNHVTLTADTYRRVIVTHLKPPQERPEKRYFSRDLVTECTRQHRRFVIDALSWLHFYEGQEYVPQRGFGSFEQWNNVVGGFVEWLLGVHPADTAETLTSEDHELLERLLEHFPYHEPTAVEQMVADAQSSMFGRANSSFTAALREISPSLNVKELVRWLRQREGLACKGKVLHSTKTNLGRAFYVTQL